MECDTRKQLQRELEAIGQPDEQAMEASRKHWDRIAKPLKGLGRLEEMITAIAGIQGQEEVVLEKKAVVVLCTDNGVVEEGVTQTDNQVTAIVAENFAKGIASVNRMADLAHADVIPVDIGVARDLTEPGVLRRKIAYGTRNLAKEPAMSEEEAIRAICIGMDLVRECRSQGYRLLATGEMGIGNTTTSSAIAAVLLGLPAEQMTGKGAGLSREGIRHKAEVIRAAIALHQPDRQDVLSVLAALGGFDIAGMVGLFLGGARFGVPVIIDGMISSVAALIAARLCPAAVSYMLPSHMSKEPSSRMIMDELGLKPVIHGDLALGEGTGAVLLFPMLDMAYAVYRENSTFEKIQVEAYQSFDEEETL